MMNIYIQLNIPHYDCLQHFPHPKFFFCQLQVLPDHMLSIRKSLQAMEDVEIGCGPAGAPHPDEVVSVKWVDEDKAFNIG